MRSRKQIERQHLLMESSLAYPRGKEEKAETQKDGKNLKGEQTLGYVGVVNTVTSREDVPLRGSDEGYVFVLYMMFHENRVNAMYEMANSSKQT
ncbi:hypothetical protein AVEN_240059-1 [Araneus ventricosus]|uniref:Uncharacterized protein n=1 Tax=Araneus ventricosus TaxID=182803 RepID=A0A4Y2HKD1_ARAVE|nr:hypothetical protein AVEN_240059-1 [Araneus ventricosus]